MERELLRKVQLTQLEIANEIKRVCDENGLRFFLTDGTMLGAVRHQGFIPWDDDMDVGMVRSDYEKFCQIAPEKLKPEFCIQSWYTDSKYSLPFAKVRKRNTVYQEDKSSFLKENGFYVDVFPFDHAYEDSQKQNKLIKQLCHIARTKLMKGGYQPWVQENGINWVKRIGYIAYQVKALFYSNERLAQQYDRLVKSVPASGTVYEQAGLSYATYYPAEMFDQLAVYSFENVDFPGVKDYDQYLTISYGDYMQLPPEDQRENRHLIVKVDFGE